MFVSMYILSSSSSHANRVDEFKNVLRLLHQITLENLCKCGRSHWLPYLPTVAGDEGVGEVIEIGKGVNRVVPGQRVVLKSRLRGTWRFYAIFDQMDLQVVSPDLPLAEAATISIAPRMAYRMLQDFRKVNNMESVVQTAANSPCGQMVIQLCKLWDIDSINILGTNERQDEMKEYLINLGASAVFSLEEAEKLTYFSTSLSRPVLGLNCHGGRHQAVIMKFMEKCGTVVNYGNALYEPIDKLKRLRPDLKYHQFHIADYDTKASIMEQDVMFKFLASMMVVKKLKGPLCTSLEMRDYTQALKYTLDCPNFSRVNIFDLSMPP